MNVQPSTKMNGLPALLFWGLVWQLLAILLNNSLLLPGPFAVVRCLGRLAGTVSFWHTTLVSVGRVLTGMILAALLAVVLAVGTARIRLLEVLLAPAMTALQATPVASFTILVLIWLDRDWVPVLICGMMVLPVVWRGVHTGIRMTDPQLLEMARAFRLPSRSVLKRIYVPSVMPFFRSAVASALGLGWKAGIAAEVLTVPRNSIGRMISESKLYLLTEELFAWTLAVIILSLLLQKVILKLLNKGVANA